MTPSRLTPEMLQWLTDNRDDYEFYLLHSMFHDPLRRMAMLAVPLTPEDFVREEYAIVLRALSVAHKVVGVIGHSLPCPPTEEFLRTYVDSAARIEGSDDETVAGAMKLVRNLQDPSYSDQHYCVSPYFEAWYGAVRAKKAARELQKVTIPDVRAQLSVIQTALSAAAQAAAPEEEDPMDAVFQNDNLIRQVRRSTGITGLDECLNGGWGDEECYLIFGGTGSGKSVLTGQCAWHELKFNDGWPLVVTTELTAREYVARTVSNAASVRIDLVQDCQNVAQIRQAVGSDVSANFRLPQVDEVISSLSKRLRVHKISPDDGMDARTVLEREALKYEAKTGRLPSLVILDWLGSVADLNSGNGKSSADRAQAWESSASGCVRFADESKIPTVVLAQAVNDSQLKPILTINDIGIAKGIGKNMTAVIGITNTLDKAGILDATRGKADMPRSMILQDQFFCVCKARKGEGRNVPVTRDFRYQKFIARNRQ